MRKEMCFTSFVGIPKKGQGRPANPREDLAEDVDRLKEFFRAMHPKIVEADIEEFEANYRGSESERKDLIDLYKKNKGKMKGSFAPALIPN